MGRSSRRQGQDQAQPPQVRLDGGGIARIVPSDYVSGFDLIVDETPQSHVDLEDPTHLHFEYIARMGAVIDQLGEPGSALTAVHLGAGAMTIPRYIATTRAGSRQQVIEWEAPLVQLVREHLPLPRNAAIRTRINDARAGVKALPAALQGACDLVVSDVFSGAQTPAHLTSLEFYQELKVLLRPDGVLLVNLADGPGLHYARSSVATLQTVFSSVILLAEAQVIKGRRFGNLVAAASATELPTRWLPRLMQAGPHPAQVVSGDDLGRFTAGARIITDAQPQASPQPNASIFSR